MYVIVTVNEEIFAKIYSVKISLTIPLIGNTMNNANINLREIVNFLEYAKMYTRENIYVLSIISIHCAPSYLYNTDRQECQP